MLKIGTAKTDITPQTSLDLAGFIARTQPMLGVHDPLYARIMVLENDGKSCIFIVCDILSFSFQVTDWLRDRITRETGIPKEQIMVTTTHTHSGPITSFLTLKKEGENLPQNTGSYGRRKHLGEVNPQYLYWMTDKISQAVNEALHNPKMEEVREISFYQTEIKGLSLDRRAERGLKDVHGPLVTAQADVDNSLSAICFKNSEGDIQAILINYACHPVLRNYTNRYVSADYPGVLMKKLEVATGGQVLFMNGACGNINPIMVGGSWEEMEDFGIKIADRIGEALKNKPKIQFTGEQIPKPVMQSRIIQLPLRVLSMEEVEAIRKQDQERLQFLKKENKDNFEFRVLDACLQWGEETVTKIKTGNIPTFREMEITVGDLGVAKIMALSGEIFSRIGKDIKTQVGGNCFVVGYTNGNSGYIPTAEALLEGGYETEQAYRLFSTFPFSPQVETVVKEVTISLALDGKTIES